MHFAKLAMQGRFETLLAQIWDTWCHRTSLAPGFWDTVWPNSMPKCSLGQWQRVNFFVEKIFLRHFLPALLPAFETLWGPLGEPRCSNCGSKAGKIDFLSILIKSRMQRLFGRVKEGKSALLTRGRHLDFLKKVEKLWKKLSKLYSKIGSLLLLKGEVPAFAGELKLP